MKPCQFGKWVARKSLFCPIVLLEKKINRRAFTLSLVTVDELDIKKRFVTEPRRSDLTSLNSDFSPDSWTSDYTCEQVCMIFLAQHREPTSLSLNSQYARNFCTYREPMENVRLLFCTLSKNWIVRSLGVGLIDPRWTVLSRISMKPHQ